MSPDSAGRPWCWSEDADDIVVKAQPAVAVYPGPAGIVIRAQGDLYGDGDKVIWFCVHQAHAVAKAILEAAGLDIADLITEPAQDATKPMASTSAARQRRYRDRKKKEPALFDSDERNVTEGESVTSRDGTKT